MGRVNTTLTHLWVIFPGCIRLFPLIVFILFYFIFLYKSFTFFRSYHACVNAIKKGVQWCPVALGLVIRTWWPTKTFLTWMRGLWTEGSVGEGGDFFIFLFTYICVMYRSFKVFFSLLWAWKSYSYYIYVYVYFFICNFSSFLFYLSTLYLRLFI